MIRPEHETMMNIKTDSLTINNWFAFQLNNLQRMRVYTAVKLQEEICKEEAEVSKKFIKRPSDIYFATKITDDIYVVENITRYSGEQRTLYIPYLKSSGNSDKNSLTCYETFEHALIAAICLQNGLDDAQIGIILQMITKLGK